MRWGIIAWNFGIFAILIPICELLKITGSELDHILIFSFIYNWLGFLERMATE